MTMKPKHFDHLLLVKEDLTKKGYSIKFSVYCILYAIFHHWKVFKNNEDTEFTSKSKLLGKDWYSAVLSAHWLINFRTITVWMLNMCNMYFMTYDTMLRLICVRFWIYTLHNVYCDKNRKKNCTVYFS